MQFQLNTDRTIEGTEQLAAEVRGVVDAAANGMAEHITRVEVHLADENAGKGGDDDKRCLIEARIGGREPLTVTHRAGSVAEAVEGAGHKLRRRLESATRERPDPG